MAVRVAQGATNLLVTGVILIAGLSFGRQVILWWRADAASSSSSQLAAGLSDRLSITAAEPSLLEFGDFPYALQRRPFTGDVQQTLAMLRDDCRSVLEQKEPALGEPGPAERRLLLGTRHLRPVVDQSGEWSIYEIETPVPMVVGVRRFTTQVGEPELRVVSWGLAVPDVRPDGEADSAWTLVTYAASASFVRRQQSPSLPVPPGGQRIFSLATQQGGTLTGFRGEGSLVDWIRFHETWFAASGWHMDVAWQATAGVWNSRFSHPTTGTCEILLLVERDNSLRSLITTSPPTDAEKN